MSNSRVNSSILIALCFTVVSCGKVSHQADAKLRIFGGTIQDSVLLPMASRVVERRAQAQSGTGSLKVISGGSGVYTVSLQTGGSASATDILKQMTEPMGLFLMFQDTSSGAAIHMPKYGGFSPSKLTEREIVGAQSISSSGASTVILILSKTGSLIVQDLYKTHKDQLLGLFLRGHLVSVMKVPESTNKPISSISIGGIPNSTIADMFLEDILVGRFTSLTPLP